MGFLLGMHVLLFVEVSFRVRYGAPQVRSLMIFRVKLCCRALVLCFCPFQRSRWLMPEKKYRSQTCRRCIAWTTTREGETALVTGGPCLWTKPSPARHPRRLSDLLRQHQRSPSRQKNNRDKRTVLVTAIARTNIQLAQFTLVGRCLPLCFFHKNLRPASPTQ